MADKIKVFVDSDVIISSQISNLGAAYLLLYMSDLKFYISNLSLLELMDVAKRLNINTQRLAAFVKRRFVKIDIAENLKEVTRKFGEYTRDPFDVHVVAGAAKVKVKFLLTYNLKDYKFDRIKKDFKIIVITPANLLQYLRFLE